LCHIYFRLIAVIFNFSLIRTSDRVRGSLIVLPDLENMSVAVGLSMLSCTQADKDVNTYQLPVNSRHLDFRHTQLLDSLHSCPLVLLSPVNIGIAGGISLPSCIQAEMNVIFYPLPVKSDHV
jgi:hypothetical protein